MQEGPQYANVPEIMEYFTCMLMRMIDFKLFIFIIVGTTVDQIV